MPAHKPFSCVLIGRGTLPIQCGEALLSRGHTIRAIVSSDVQLRRWAEQRGIGSLETPDELCGISRQPFDYLFSIVNDRILPNEVLELPQKLSINYHDALLPRYAGSHATSWALIHRERIHGVTWHVMSDTLDAGDILKQRSFPISAGETAFTLNAKCYEAAIRAFAELSDALSCGRVSAKKQDLRERTFFALSLRPPTGCVLSWNALAEDIDAFIRALDFGQYANPLGFPKVAIGNGFVMLSKIDLLNSVSKAPPGTVVGIEECSIKVSTASREIALRKVLAMDGESLPIPDFVARFGLHEGYRFPDLDEETAGRITALDALCCRHERFWVERLASLRPGTIPYAGWNVSERDRTAGCSTRLMPIPAKLMSLREGEDLAGSAGDFLAAAYGAYLARLGDGGSFDIGFGERGLQQDLNGLEELFAPYVPLRVDVNSAQSFADFFAAMRAELELVRRHKTYGRDVVARYPELRSLRGRKDLLPVAVSCVRSLQDCQSISVAGLTLVMPEDRAECLWAYSPALLGHDSVASMLDGFAAFLRGITANPDRRVAELPLLSEEERNRVIVESNDTRVEYPAELCAHELIEAQVERTPESVALVYEQQKLSYREMNARANQLACYLQRLGVGPEVLVGLCMERSLEMIVGLLGILKAGGAYVPLDPYYPAERLAFMLNDSRVSVLLTQQRLLHSIPEHCTHVVCLDADWEAIARESTENLASGATAENLAYAIYTSGSTGRPKGVLVEHRGLCNLAKTQAQTCGVGPGSRVLQFCSLSFDPSIFDIAVALSSGATLCLSPQSSLLPGQAMIRLLRDQAITMITLPPSVLAPLPDEPLPALQTIVVGAEPCSMDVLRRWGRGRRFFNIYGVTEATVFSTIAECSDTGRRPHIGRPIANTQVYVLDAQRQPVPSGLPGELYIGGVGVARGYLNLPELTAERFVPNPFSDEPRSRLYKTGDLARHLPDGNIEFLGRLDHQVKIRGFRIEPGEVEAALLHHPAVREAVVLAREDEPGDRRLVAYLVANERHAPSLSELRSFLKAKLPDYMVPSSFVTLDSLPLNPNGKVDRGALPVPEQARPGLEVPLVAARTRVEQLLSAIWAQALGLKQVSIYDNFFDLGGNSLLGMQVIARLEKELGLRITLRELGFQTLGQLAAACEERLPPMPSRQPTA